MKGRYQILLVGVGGQGVLSAAQILGAAIHAAAWEMLAAILCFEAAFGVQGVLAAPILFAYVKRELSDRQLI